MARPLFKASPPPLTPGFWAGSSFFGGQLPAQTARLRADFAGYQKHGSLWAALNACRRELFRNLPLLLCDIFDGDISSLAAPQGSQIVAERIRRVPDENIDGQCRVDFFVYRWDGHVVRQSGTS